MRRSDGSSGDADYGAIGHGYRSYRRPEPAFAAAIGGALGAARTVLNVGAGAGSYEPTDRRVLAVEPSATMRAQRPAGLGPVLDAVAGDLPLADDAVDAAMTSFSVHQWPDVERGLGEMRRVARGPVTVLTCDPDRLARSWIAGYAPEVIATEARRYPAPDRIAAALGGSVEHRVLPIPHGCVDGFTEAYYGRPETLLDPGARAANSAWSFVDAEQERRAVEHLRRDLADGTWDRRHGALRTAPTWEGSLILLVARP